MRKRGTPLPINGALNRSRTKLGLELGTWMVIVFVSISVFLVGFRMLALLSFPVLAGSAWLVVRKHPKCSSFGGTASSRRATMTRVSSEQTRLMLWYAKAGAASSIVPVIRWVSPTIFATKYGGYGVLAHVSGIDEEIRAPSTGC